LGLLAPVYAQGGSGLGVLFGPTGGFLWGFLPCVILVGWLAERFGANRPISLVPIAIAGLIPIYALGALWLAWQLDLSLTKALAVGVAPFVVFDLFKAAVAAGVAAALLRSPLALAALPQERRTR
jgi:biotin transport system substrate-specific component